MSVVWSATFPGCLSRYKVGAFSISDVDVSGEPHPALQYVIVNTIPRHVVTSLSVCYAHRVGVFH